MRQRHWILWAVLIGLTLFVITRFTSLRSLGETLGQANWLWVLVAVGVQLGYFLLYPFLYKTVLRSVRVRLRWGHIVPIYFAAICANTVAPTGGAAGAALFVDEASHRGQSGARTAVATILVLVLDLSALLPFLAYAVAFLYVTEGLQYYEAVGSALFVAFISLLAGSLVVAYRHPNGLRRLLERIRRIVNRLGARFRRPEILASDWATRNAADLTSAAGAVTQHPARLARALLLSVFLHTVNLAALVFLFLAFGQHVRLGTLVAGFGMGIVFYVVSIVPQGLAAVEGVMALVFTSLGVPSPKALAIILAFRGLNYWIPLFVGFFFLRRVRIFGGGESVKPDEDRTS